MVRTAFKTLAASAALATTLLTTGVAASEPFNVVSSRDAFVSLIQGRELRRFGIRLTVTSDGTIQGRAFGSDVTGEWAWNDGYFCRDLFYGQDDLGFNCQLVQVSGNTLRFTSDQGQGIYADLTLR